MKPGGFRVDLGALPTPILTLFIQANLALRQSWTLSDRLLEIIRLFSAYEHECHT
ncbi:MAG: hypothetical protein JRG96_11910 [Deltaproteobacteria bacterium]|nr:hypothetical protein [Deltaproteobacteria bacterium]MBW2420434.1 hypothetical protein [Deltaproteobacteria bacterium]